MSSGWPPEEDDRRWEPVRHASVVGAGHDSRGAERGNPGYAGYPANAGESGGFGPYDVPPSYDEDGWYAADGTPAPADASHPSGPLPGTRGGYGGSGEALYGAPVYTEADYGAAGPGDALDEDGAYEAPPWAGEFGPAGYGQAHPPGEAHYAGARSDRQPYAGEDGAGEQYPREQDTAQHTARYTDDGYGPYDPDASHPGQQAGSQPGGYPGTGAGGYGQAGYGEANYDEAGYGQAGYGQTGYGAGPGYQQASHADYPDTGEQPADYPEPGYRPAGYAGGPHDRGGYQPAPVGEPDSGYQDYGFQDYGDPRYDDPSYGDLAYDDTPYPGSGGRGTTQASPAYADDGIPDPGYGDQRHASGGYGYPAQPGPAAADYGSAYPAVGTPGYADDGEYGAYPASGAPAGELRPDGGYPADGYDGYDGAAEDREDPGPELPGHGAYGPSGSGGPGYVAAEYASGQFPPGIGTIGELSAGMPDPAATGMLEATGMLDSTGISDRVELFNYHPGAAEASQGFLDAPAPVGTLDVTGIDPPGFLDDQARGEHGIILDGAEAGDATGVLEGGSGFFDDAAPAEITSFDLPAESLGRDGKTGGTGALLRPRPSSRPAGRRRGRSGDRRLWFALAGVVVVFVGAIVAIVMVAFPSGPGGPAHTLVTPSQLNAFTRRPALEQQMNVSQLRQDVVNTSSGQARHVVEAVYEAGNSTSGSTPQIILFIGGNLLNASPQVSVTSFTQRFAGARITSAGGLGEAACVNATASQPGSVAMCAWFDNDSFGEVVSPTMNAAALANTMRQIRPHVELVAKQKP